MQFADVMIVKLHEPPTCLCTNRAGLPHARRRKGLQRDEIQARPIQLSAARGLSRAQAVFAG